MRHDQAPVAASVNVHVEVIDLASGRCVQESWHHNRVVDAGLNALRDVLFGDAGIQVTHGAVGASNTPAAAGDTGLEAEVFRDVVAQRAKGDKALQVRFVLGSQHANGVTLREAGLFLQDGRLYARVLPAAVTKTALQSVLYTWTLSFEAVTT